MREFTCLGPKKATELLLRFEKAVEEGLRSSLAESLQKEAHRLDDSFDHYGAIVITSPIYPCMSLFVDGNGRTILGLSYLDPSETASAPYKIGGVNTSSLSKAYSSLFGENPQDIKSKIFQSPIRTPFLAICGERRLLGKILLKEQINSQRFFRYAEVVKDGVFEYLLSHHNRVQEHDDVQFHVYCKGSSVYLTLLKDPVTLGGGSDLLQTVAQHYKERLVARFPETFLKTEEFFKVPVEGQKLLTLRVLLERLEVFYKKLPDFMKSLKSTLDSLVITMEEGMEDCLERVQKLLIDS
ncbi:MAG: hypothetical protein DRP27_08330 [Thermotogae bacterium]|mgnify:CR=1 FL=1|nr:MAG: hypothetical protein DRP27_08330 [Thermotogota bacterium]